MKRCSKYDHIVFVARLDEEVVRLQVVNISIQFFEIDNSWYICLAAVLNECVLIIAEEKKNSHILEFLLQ